MKLAEFTNFQRQVESPHYLALNFENLLGETGTVEVRYHQSTIEFKRVSGWISLWMTLLWGSNRADCSPLITGQKLPLPGQNGWGKLPQIMKTQFSIPPDSPFIQHLEDEVKISEVNWQTRMKKVGGF